MVKIRKYDDAFVQRFHHVLDMINSAVVQERMASPWLVDRDVVEVYKAVAATMRTLSSGIYYESLPEGPLRVSLYRRIKDGVDQLMRPDVAGDHPVLKATEAVEVLDFITYAAQANSSVRPRSRRYLDWICDTFGYPQPQKSSGLIIP